MSKVLGLKKQIKSISNIGRITNTLYKVSLSYVSFWEQAIANVKDFYKRFVKTIILSGYEIEPYLKELYKDTITSDTIIIWGPRQGLCGTLIARLKEVLTGNKPLLNNSTHIILINEKLHDFVSSLIDDKNKLIKIRMDSYTSLKGVSAFAKQLYSYLGTLGEQSFTAIYPFYNGNLDYDVRIEEIDLLSSLRTSLREIKQELQDHNNIQQKGSLNSQVLEQFPQPLREPLAVDVPVEDMAVLLIDYFLFTGILVRSIHSLTSEHIGRMVAMKNATDNVKQILKDLQLSYNRQRQAAITNELLDIVNAKRALD